MNEIDWSTNVPQSSPLRRRLRLHTKRDDVHLRLIRLAAVVFEKTFRASAPNDDDIGRFLGSIHSCVGALEYEPNLEVFGTRTTLEETTAMLVDVLYTNPPLKCTQVSNAFLNVWPCMLAMMSFPNVSSATLKHAMLHVAIFVGTSRFASRDFNPYLRILTHTIYDYMEMVQSQLD